MPIQKTSILVTLYSVYTEDFTRCLFNVLIKCELSTIVHIILSYQSKYQNKLGNLVFTGALVFLGTKSRPTALTKFVVSSDLDVELSWLGGQGSLVQVIKVGVEQGLLG